MYIKPCKTNQLSTLFMTTSNHDLYISRSISPLGPTLTNLAKTIQNISTTNVDGDINPKGQLYSEACQRCLVFADPNRNKYQRKTHRCLFGTRQSPGAILNQSPMRRKKKSLRMRNNMMEKTKKKSKKKSMTKILKKSMTKKLKKSMESL